MRFKNFSVLFSLTIGAVAGMSACSNGGQQPVPGAVDTAPAAVPPPIAPVVASPQERQLYLDAARTSWNLVNRITEPSTGLARAHARYSYVTLWDIAGVIAANYTAHELAFIDDATYDAHIQRILATLTTVDLFDRTAFNRIYDAKTGRMVDNAGKISNIGAGWSSVDIGRLLVWLRIVSTKQPKYLPLATQVVRRLNMSQVLDDGFLRGLQVDPKTGKKQTFTEDEIGYQQYALSGFSMWGARVNSAGLDVRKNVAAIDVLGVRLLISSPGNDRVMSEPFIMMGMETGFRSADLARQAVQVLAAQTARYQQTRVVTAVTEDALPDPPYYFYYYSVYHRGNSFVVESLDDKVVERPRWVSSKAAFGWNAVLPSAYTQLLLKTVRPAGTVDGWGSGVYEDTLQPTGIPSLNTAALIMESALYKARGRPILAN
ncbi:MAG: hypothetical protein QOD47_62 [Gemmatimonadaceae bacterium]|nr:hypothetical protein [Gemmatimonadaceae bacterium]